MIISAVLVLVLILEEKVLILVLVLMGHVLVLTPNVLRTCLFYTIH